MADLRGVFSLDMVRELQNDSEWDSVDNVWVFPDRVSSGTEFKYVDGTITVAPPATPPALTTSIPLSYKKEGKIISTIDGDTNFGKKIAITDNTLAIISDTRLHIYEVDGYISESTEYQPELKVKTIKLPGDTLLDVAVGGSKIFVGGGSTVYRYDLDGTNEVRINSATATGDFGKAIDATNTHIVVGSTGKAHIFTHSGSGEVTLTGSLGGSSSYGNAVGISTYRVVVGDPGYSPTGTNNSGGRYGGPNEGAAYLYNLSGTEIAVLSNQRGYDRRRWDRYGHAIAIDESNDTVIVSAPTRIGLQGNNMIDNSTDYNDDVGEGIAYGYRLKTGDLVTRYSNNLGDNNRDSNNNYSGTGNFPVRFRYMGDSIAVDRYGERQRRSGQSSEIYFGAGGSFTNLSSDADTDQCAVVQLKKPVPSYNDYTHVGEFRNSDFLVAGGEEFGYGIKATKDKVVISTRSATKNALYVYNHDGTGEVKIEPSDGAAGDYFGSFHNNSFDTNGEKIAVASRCDVSYGGTTYTESGALYIYNMDGSGEIKVVPPAEDLPPNPNLSAPGMGGLSVVAIGKTSKYTPDRIFVSAWQWGGSVGAVWMYDMDGNKMMGPINDSYFLNGKGRSTSGINNVNVGNLIRFGYDMDVQPLEDTNLEYNNIVISHSKGFMCWNVGLDTCTYNDYNESSYGLVAAGEGAIIYANHRWNGNTYSNSGTSIYQLGKARLYHGRETGDHPNQRTDITPPYKPGNQENSNNRHDWDELYSIRPLNPLPRTRLGSDIAIANGKAYIGSGDWLSSNLNDDVGFGQTSSRESVQVVVLSPFNFSGENIEGKYRGKHRMQLQSPHRYASTGQARKENFGASVAAYGNKVWVGAPRSGDEPQESGATWTHSNVHIFELKEDDSIVGLSTQVVSDSTSISHPYYYQFWEAHSNASMRESDYGSGQYGVYMENPRNMYHSGADNSGFGRSVGISTISNSSQKNDGLLFTSTDDGTVYFYRRQSFGNGVVPEGFPISRIGYYGSPII